MAVSQLDALTFSVTDESNRGFNSAFNNVLIHVFHIGFSSLYLATCLIVLT